MRALTVALFFLSFSALAQNNSIHVYPWNPDSDQDNHIGVADLQSFLTVYGNDFGLPPEPCTYDGTDFEDLIFGIADGTIILDSMYIELELEQIASYYPLGCPDQVTDTVIFSNSAMLHNDCGYCQCFNTSETTHFGISGSDVYGGQVYFKLASVQNGYYNMKFTMPSLIQLGFLNDGFFGGTGGWGGAGCSVSESYTIPLPQEWIYDSLGLHILEEGWYQGWITYANYLHMLPYWHYADE